MTDQQPMKMAAAEALWDTKKHADFSLFAYADLDGATGTRARKRQHRDPGRAVDPGDQPPERHGRGHQRRPAGAEAPSTVPGSYIPVVWLAYWIVPADDRARRAGRADRIFARRPVAARQARPRRWRAAAGRRLDGRAAAAGQQRRLALHRDRPPALARLRPAEDEGRRQHQRRHRFRLHHPRPVHGALRRARRHLLPDGPTVRQGRPRRDRPPARRRVRRLADDPS